jgi:predicted dehydrogenase
VRATDRTVIEAFHYLYHPLMQRTIEIVRSGELGRLVSVESGYGSMGRPRGDIRWSLPLAGGALMDVGCYPVHLLRSVVGTEPAVVRASADVADAGVDGDMRIELRFEGGVSGVVRTSMQSQETYVYARFVGEEGELEVQNPFVPHKGNTLTITSGGTTRVETTTTEPSYVFQLRALVDVVQHGAPVLTGLDDAIRNMDVIDAAYRAAGLEPRRPTVES